MVERQDVFTVVVGKTGRWFLGEPDKSSKVPRWVDFLPSGPSGVDEPVFPLFVARKLTFVPETVKEEVIGPIERLPVTLKNKNDHWLHLKNSLTLSLCMSVSGPLLVGIFIDLRSSFTVSHCGYRHVSTYPKGKRERWEKVISPWVTRLRKYRWISDYFGRPLLF